VTDNPGFNQTIFW